jgi:hypothetical protein
MGEQHNSEDTIKKNRAGTISMVKSTYKVSGKQTLEHLTPRILGSFSPAKLEKNRK